MGKRTTCESGGGARKSEVKFLSPSGSAIFCFEGKMTGLRRDKGQGFPKLVELRFFVQVRQTERWRMIAAATLERLALRRAQEWVRKASAV